MSTQTLRSQPFWKRFRKSNTMPEDTTAPTTSKVRRSSSIATTATNISSRRRTGSVNTVMSFNEECSASNIAVMDFLQNSCPDDVLPKILAYCGPQQTAALSVTNKSWNNFIRKESTWRVMCEELYKWKQGDPEPDSWYDLYRYTPCVPIDYSTIPKALAITNPKPLFTRNRRHKPINFQIRPVRILLRPGKYALKECIRIQAARGVIVTIETMSNIPTNIYRPTRGTHHEIMEQPLPINTTSSSRPPKRSPSFRNILSACGKQQEEYTEPTEDNTEYAEDYLDVCGGGNTSTVEPPKHATILLRSRHPNEPVFRVQQGRLALKNIEIQHNSQGLDIWNGNAAIQIQPPTTEDDLPMPNVIQPRAFLDRVQVSSKSGRGIVNIDGGKLFIRNSAIYDCAATGIYIGGPGSQAMIENTDVIRNGIGNRQRARGIARGHSGIYLEQGIAQITNSNISQNTLTGISVVSHDNASLTLKRSSLIANGTYQLELPPLGTTSRQRCNTTDNNLMSSTGELRQRSGLTLSEPPTPPQPTVLTNTLLPFPQQPQQFLGN